MKTNQTFAKSILARLVIAVLVMSPCFNLDAGNVRAVEPSSATTRESAEVPQSTQGTWRGFFQGIDDPNIRGTVSLDIISQFVRHFEGMLQVSGISNSNIWVRGTAAASNNISFASVPDDSYMAIGNAQLQDFGGAAVLSGRLTLRLPDGTRLKGTLLLLRNFIDNPNIAPPDVTGDWRGRYTSGVTELSGEMTASFTRSRTDRTGFSAVTTLVPCTFPEGLGTINARGEFVVIGQGEGEYAIFQGTVDYHVDEGGAVNPFGKGSYLMVHNDGTQDFGTFHIDKVGVTEVPV